jgi:hypothetical protein
MNWTGEEKLRVVLEAMKTSVAQVCAKYAKHGLVEEQIQSWRQLVADKGGEIFSPPQQSATIPRSSSRSRKRSPLLIFVATFSVLVNLGLVAFAAVIYFEVLDVSPWLPESFTSANSSSSLARSPMNATGGSQSPNGVNAQSGSLPNGGFRPATRLPNIVSEVEICGVRGRGHKIVFVVDLNDYMLVEPNGKAKFERLRSEINQAIDGLSENSLFNLIFIHGVSRLHLLDKNLVSASPSKKQEAIDWLSFPLDDNPISVAGRFTEKDFESQLHDGVIGPFRALEVALSQDPDLIYLMTGDCASLHPDDFSTYELSGVRAIYDKGSSAWENWRLETDVIRSTLSSWLLSDSMRAEGAVSSTEIDTAIKRLAITMPLMPAGAPNPEWPWEDIYMQFKTGFQPRQITDLASTHVVVSLPATKNWPLGLDNACGDFARLSGGSLTFLDADFFSSAVKP